MSKQSIISREEAKQILDNSLRSHQEGLIAQTLQARVLNRFISYLEDREPVGETEKEIVKKVKDKRSGELERMTKQMERTVKALDVLESEYQDMLGKEPEQFVKAETVAAQMLVQWRKEVYGLGVSERIQKAIDDGSKDSVEISLEKELATEAVAVLLSEYPELA